MNDIATRVAKGVAMLDERRPGWEGQIDLITLDIMSTDTCVLGQVYGGFHTGIRDLNFDGVWEMGFDCDVHSSMRDQHLEFYELTQEWTRVITILRSKQQAEVKEEAHVGS